MKRFNWHEIRECWQLHSCRWGEIDYLHDPDGLGNVCQPGEPLWLNQYYARFQRKVYQELFALLPQPITRASALDVGCGAGRWCRFLADHGYETIGIDLQPQLIEMNRRRNPEIEFFCTALQDFSYEKPFDLVSSVTVLQHIPFEDQNASIRKIRELLKKNGYAIILENIKGRSPAVFSNKIEEWQAKFEKIGFRSLAIRRYDYSPFIRLHSWMEHKLRSIFRRSLLYDTDLSPEVFVTRNDSKSSKSRLRKFLSILNRAAKKMEVELDAKVEPIFVQSNIALPTVHCGFLFKAI